MTAQARYDAVMARDHRRQTGSHAAHSPLPRTSSASSRKAEVTLASGWARDENLVAASVADVVDGLYVIAGEAVPFGRLPRKWGRYASQFPRWSAVADQNLGSLLSLPGIGESAVRALITTARESVRAARTSPTAEEISAADAVEARRREEHAAEAAKVEAAQILKQAQADRTAAAAARKEAEGLSTRLAGLLRRVSGWLRRADLPPQARQDGADLLREAGLPVPEVKSSASGGVRSFVRDLAKEPPQKAPAAGPAVEVPEVIDIPGL